MSIITFIFTVLCACVCVCVHAYECECVCVCVRVHTCMQVCVVCTCTQNHDSAYIHTWTRYTSRTPGWLAAVTESTAKSYHCLVQGWVCTCCEDQTHWGNTRRLNWPWNNNAKHTEKVSGRWANPETRMPNTQKDQEDEVTVKQECKTYWGCTRKRNHSETWVPDIQWMYHSLEFFNGIICVWLA